MDWDNMKQELRSFLQDTGATVKWSDEDLFTFFKDAIRDYSTWFPHIPDRAQLSGTGTGPYTLPADFVEVVFVESPENRFLEKRSPRPGVRFPTQAGRPFHWYIQGGSLYLDTAPLDSEDEVLLTYKAVHPLPDDVNDDDFVLTIPDADLELPKIYVAAKVYGQQRQRQASLDRFKTRVSAGNTRQDNPLEIEVDLLMNEYYAKVSMRLKSEAVRLNRPGRMR